MKTKFFPKFVLITAIVMTVLIIGTQLLGFKPNVSATIAEFFFYAVALKFATVFLDEEESEKILYFIKFMGVILILVTVAALVDLAIEKIFDINLKVEGMAAYTALALGYLLGVKFVNFFSKKLFEENETKDEEKLDLGEDIDNDIAHIS